MKEGTFSEFLVIKFTEYKEVGMIALTKKKLIKKIIAAPTWWIATPIGLQQPLLHLV
jgi:hypothetical protein